MNTHEIGYLQHGKAGEPMRTESVSVKHFFASNYQAYYEGRWRVVHIQVNRLFIVYRGEKITIQIEGV